MVVVMKIISLNNKTQEDSQQSSVKDRHNKKDLMHIGRTRKNF
jgi:hypothetical protein